MSGHTRVLLTGGSGLVGKKVAELLRDRYEVIHFETRDPAECLPWTRGELRDPESVEGACRDVPGEPLEPYGLTKKLGKQMCRFFSEKHSFSTICLRPGGISPEDAPLGAQFGFLFGGVDVRDVAQAHALAVAAPEAIRHETFNTLPDSPLCTVDPTQFLEDPVGCLEALRPGVRRLIESERVRLSVPAEWFTIDKARELLGYRPQHNFEVPVEAEGDT